MTDQVPKKRGRPRKTPLQGSFDFDNLPEDSKSYIKASYAARKRSKEQWRGMFAVPPNTLIERVINEFQKKTNISLEIPFFTFMHFVAGFLIGKGSTIEFQGREIEADFWTIILAGSGAGKTWTQKEIKIGFGDDAVPELQASAVSAARWLEELEAKPRALWIRDEFFQLLKQIETPGPMADLKDLLLRTYDNAPLTRSTRKDTVTVDHPVLSILGYSATAPFLEGMSIESLTDGFAQRFGYVLSKPDPARDWRNYPVWTVDNKDWKAGWSAMTAHVQKKYTVSDDAVDAFLKSFKDLSGGDVDESFYRRILWRAHKYALIYHIIRGQAKDPVVAAEDYGWAARVISLQLSDAAELIQKCSGSDLDKMFDQVERCVEKLNAADIAITPREIIRRCSLIKTSSAAQFCLSLLGIR